MAEPNSLTDSESYPSDRLLDGSSAHDRPIDHDHGNSDVRDQNFTARAIAAGLCIGVVVNLSNIYYGLRIGAGNSMALVSTLLGYALFKYLPRNLPRDLSKGEHVLLLSTATSVGSMPITAGFIGIIPALEYLLEENEDGPLSLAFGNLIMWSIGLCFFGIIFSSLLREQFVRREKLPWPGPTAVTHLLTILHLGSDSSSGIPVGKIPRSLVPREDDTASN